jgi:hypothetical protein
MRGVSFGLRISRVAVSICERGEEDGGAGVISIVGFPSHESVFALDASKRKVGKERRGKMTTHIDDHINMTIPLLLEDTVRSTDEESPSLEQVDLL